MWFGHFIVLTKNQKFEKFRKFEEKLEPLKKGAMGNMNVDKVDDMMADIQDAQDTSNEIADAIARPMGMQVIIFVMRFLEDISSSRTNSNGTYRADL